MGTGDGRIIYSGEKKFSSESRNYAPLFLAFEHWLSRTIEELPPDIIIFEKPSHLKYYAAARIGVGLASITELISARYQVNVAEIEPTAIKKHATGKGNATKDMMVAAGKERWGDRVTTDNIADALWIYDYAWKLP